MQKSWLNRPYYSIGDHYREKFKERVYKISVNVADTCPNRMGLKGMQTCTFCDVWGSAAYADIRDLSLEEQIQNVHDKIIGMTKYEKFVVYFQSYTNSFASVSKLRAMYEEALKFPRVAGIVVGTRPDCISPALIQLWKEIAAKTYLSIELGVQSFYQDFLEFEKRGHSAQDSLDAIERLSQIPNLEVGLHFIFGHPGETVEHVVEQAKFTATLPVQSIKLHNLHVLKNTKLEKFYEMGLFKPIELPEYSEMVGQFIQHVPDHMAIHRLSALSSRWDELVAPNWTRHKMTMFQAMIDYMHRQKMYHGEKCVTQNDPAQKYIPSDKTFVLPEHFNRKILDQTAFEDVLKAMPRENSFRCIFEVPKIELYIPRWHSQRYPRSDSLFSNLRARILNALLQSKTKF